MYILICDALSKRIRQIHITMRCGCNCNVHMLLELRASRAEIFGPVRCVYRFFGAKIFCKAGWGIYFMIRKMHPAFSKKRKLTTNWHNLSSTRFRNNMDNDWWMMTMHAHAHVFGDAMETYPCLQCLITSSYCVLYTIIMY